MGHNIKKHWPVFLAATFTLAVITGTILNSLKEKAADERFQKNGRVRTCDHVVDHEIVQGETTLSAKFCQNGVIHIVRKTQNTTHPDNRAIVAFDPQNTTFRYYSEKRLDTGKVIWEYETADVLGMDKNKDVLVLELIQAGIKILDCEKNERAGCKKAASIKLLKAEDYPAPFAR